MGLPEFAFAMASDPGLHRKGNEDFCAASAEDGVFVVCDGMGGAAAGEVASRLAAETFLGLMRTRLAQPALPGVGVDVAGERMRGAIRAANEAVCQEAGQSAELTGMGTTLVGLMLDPAISPAGTNGSGRASIEMPPSRIWIGHVGDSRCYLLRDGDLHLLTADHSLVEEQVQAGQISREQAAHSPMRHVITRAIGSRDEVEAEIQAMEVYPGDLYLLASDGLNRELEDGEIAELMARVLPLPGPDVLQLGCGTMIAAAKFRGGHDNITVLLLYVC